MVDDEAQPVQRRLFVDLLDDGQVAVDALAVGGVQAERPAVLDQQLEHRFQLALPSCSGRSGRGSRKFSKSAALATRFSPPPSAEKPFG
jgi:hypothetical protein